MIIEITKPEVEAIINERLQRGGFKDAEDVILRALQCSEPASPLPASHPAKDLVELFAPLQGLNIDFERDRDTGRDIDL